MSAHSCQSGVSQRVDWETPRSVFDPLHAEFGFTLDVCATPENAKCASYFTPEADALAKDWGVNVCWMNPPYGRGIERWMEKAWNAAQNGATVVCLVPARTDTAWWHKWATRGEVRFRRGRITFAGAYSRAPFPNAEVIYRAPEPTPKGRESNVMERHEPGAKRDTGGVKP